MSLRIKKGLKSVWSAVTLKRQLQAIRTD